MGALFSHIFCPRANINILTGAGEAKRSGGTVLQRMFRRSTQRYDLGHSKPEYGLAWYIIYSRWVRADRQASCSRIAQTRDIVIVFTYGTPTPTGFYIAARTTERHTLRLVDNLFVTVVHTHKHM